MIYVPPQLSKGTKTKEFKKKKTESGYLGWSHISQGQNLTKFHQKQKTMIVSQPIQHMFIE